MRGEEWASIPIKLRRNWSSATMGGAPGRKSPHPIPPGIEERSDEWREELGVLRWGGSGGEPPRITNRRMRWVTGKFRHFVSFFIGVDWRRGQKRTFMGFFEHFRKAIFWWIFRENIGLFWKIILIKIPF